MICRLKGILGVQGLVFQGFRVSNIFGALFFLFSGYGLLQDSLARPVRDLLVRESVVWVREYDVSVRESARA